MGASADIGQRDARSVQKVFMAHLYPKRAKNPIFLSIKTEIYFSSIFFLSDFLAFFHRVC